METVQVLHLGCVSSVFLASKQAPDQDKKVVKAYHKGHLQVRHWLNITREVTQLRQLKELGVPGIVDLCGTADDASNVYLVFEPCFGGDLYKRLTHRGLYNEAQLCKEVVTPLLRVLHSLHQLGIIHRDIKPENIFFENDGTLRLGDFGLAINATKERPISRVGTLDYMAPEVLAQPSADVIHARKIKTTQLPSYDSKVDIWALGVLVYEALMGVTPFGDTDPQAACLKAQFRPPMPLPSGVSAGCADFVSQALSKQAARRPSAADLLAHPWVKAHSSAQEGYACVELAAACRAASGGMLGSASPSSTTLPSTACPIPPASIALSGASSRCLPCSSSSSCDLSSSAPTASPAVLSTASSLGGPFGLQLSPRSGGYGSVQHAPLAQPKPQPMQPQPQQLPPHPFAAAAAQFGTARALAPFLSAASTNSSSTASACSTPAVEGGAPVSLSIPVPQFPAKSNNTVRFARQLSSPARLRDPRLSQEIVTPPPGSPPAASTGSGARLSYLAMSPVRALLGASRNLVRSRSGAAAPAADGSVVVPPAKQPLSHSMSAGSAFTLRSPMTGQPNRPAVMLSPIRGLLTSTRRKQPAHASSVSLFAAAQWKPSGIAVTTSLPPLIPSITGSRASSSSSNGAGVPSSTGGSSTDCPRGSGLGGSKSMDCSGLMRSCSMGPNVVLGAGLVNSTSSAMPGLLDAGSGPGLVSCSSGSSNAVAAVAAMGPPPSRRMPALVGNGGSGEHQQDQIRCKQQLALLNRYPSAPDPWLLALSPVRGKGAGAVAGAPPVAVPIDRAASQGMRGMWLKVKGACRITPKQCTGETPSPPQDAECVVSRDP